MFILGNHSRPIFGSADRPPSLKAGWVAIHGQVGAFCAMTARSCVVVVLSSGPCSLRV
jgi:hypothetical protein